MTNQSTVSLFSSKISVTKIDPSIWDKDKIVDDVNYNFNLNRYRNQWNGNSNLHHYFNDWDNASYKKLNFDNLIPIYDKVVENFLLSIPKNEKILKWKWNIVNLTVYQNDQYMQIHDHLLGKTIFSAVHYVSVPKNHSTMTFVNPLMALQYAHPIIESLSKHISNKDTENSNFFTDWDFNITEDTMIIFPSYLKHHVKPSNDSNELKKLRIGIVLNIDIDED
jgi:hypothetical protein